MRLTDILQPDCVVVPLEAADKQQAVFTLADVLLAHTPVTDPAGLKDAIWQREMTRTTGIGHGIGIPHGKAKGVDKLRMAMGRLASPIEFGAIDHKPVDLILLLASPLDQTGPHIQALAKISRMLMDQDLRDALKFASSPQALYDLIVEHEAGVVG